MKGEERGSATDSNSVARKEMIDTLMNSVGLPESLPNYRIDKDKRINRFRNSEYEDFFSSGVGYVFMTKPHLNIMGGQNADVGDPFIYNIRRGTSDVARMIKYNLDPVNASKINPTTTDSDNPFISLITNGVERFETKDIVLKTKEIGENFYGEKLHWGDNYFESIGGDSLTLEYSEFSDMSITLLHKTWVDYIHAVKLNKMHPYRSSDSEYDMERKIAVDYVGAKVIDYASSIYYFLLDVDGKTIKYYAKYTGVFPTSVPFSAMSFSLGQNEAKKLSIQYQYSFKEDMDPRILDEFYYLTKIKAGIEGDKSDRPINLANNWVDRVTISKDRKRLIFFNK